VHGTAPYWRIAVEPQWGQNSFSVGAYGITDQLTAQVPGCDNVAVPCNPVTAGPYNKYTDTAIDAQYQFIADEHIFSAQTTYIYEKQNLAGSAALDPSLNPSQTLKQFRLGGSYFYQRKLGGSVGYFKINGTANATVTESATNSPNSEGYSLELDYLPWQNVKLAVQYVTFTKFNGASSNYDGTGRNASDNNTLYIFAWLAF
jgi:hypothetical protein